MGRVHISIKDKGGREMPRLKFLDSKSIVQVFEGTLGELWQAIKEYFWGMIDLLRR